MVSQLAPHGIACHLEIPLQDPILKTNAYVTICIEKKEDRDRAADILKNHFHATILKWHGVEPPRCSQCHYDLRTQSGDGECPECGCPYMESDESANTRENEGDMLRAIPCKNCDAEIVTGFNVCWQCGADRAGLVHDHFEPVDHVTSTETILRWEGEIPPSCVMCQYDLRVQAGNGKCPECGTPYKEPAAAKVRRQGVIALQEDRADQTGKSDYLAWISGVATFIGLGAVITMEHQEWTGAALFAVLIPTILVTMTVHAFSRDRNQRTDKK